VVTIPVYALVCQSDPGPLTAQQVAAGNIPAGAGCTLPSGIEFTITQDGVTLVNPANLGGPFVTTNGVFTVTLIVGSKVVITEDVTTVSAASATGVRAMILLAASYTPVRNPITIDAVAADQQGVVFVNLANRAAASPSPSPSPSPSAGPKCLPATGIGPGSPSGDEFNWWVLAALGFILGIAGLSLRRPFNWRRVLRPTRMSRPAIRHLG